MSNVGEITERTELDKRKEKIDMDIQVLSPAFHHGEVIPIQYTCDGNNVSPPSRADL
jgi:phosphatidylethanolamine-binding protein (PEBP) family uncharacterized protein